jgi:bifunctional DNase/RNase
MKPTRPLTHDLFKNFADTFGMYLQEVIIHKFYEGVFYAKLVYVSQDMVKEIDARTSDAVALAVRYNCPIFTSEEIINEAGLLMDETQEEEQDKAETKSSKKTKAEKKKVEPGNEFAYLTISELKDKLKQALDDEAYEIASLLRDEIKRRSEGK